MDYHKTAARLDQRLHNTPADTRGPFAEVLAEYGKEGRVVGPVVGFFGEASTDLGNLRDRAATELARRHVEFHRCTVGQGFNLHQHMINRKWGHVIARGWSQLILDRLRDLVVPQGPGDTPNSRYSANSGNNNPYEAYHFFTNRGGRGDQGGGGDSRP